MTLTNTCKKIDKHIYEKAGMAKDNMKYTFPTSEI